jgi:hypothetical protein
MSGYGDINVGITFRKDADGVVTDSNGSTAWFINGNGNVEVHIGVSQDNDPPYGRTIISNFMDWDSMVKEWEGVGRIIKRSL